MGCSNSKSTTAIDETKPKPAPTTDPAKAKSNKMDALPKQEYPASEAFTIPLEEENSATAVPLNDTLRQPPKRLQQLMQQAAETEPLTLEELEEKQQRAEQRRQELMQQKLEGIQKNTEKLLMRGHGEQADDGVEDALEAAEQQQQESSQH
ncbi:uncharacterized protein LOC135428182 [Drosophila montana]|uniref:uncharacterized protein LOC135428182 n=1 Tax=Drosophila montana TaxID=40370 RepID=UPI00313EB566